MSEGNDTSFDSPPNRPQHSTEKHKKQSLIDRVTDRIQKIHLRLTEHKIPSLESDNYYTNGAIGQFADTISGINYVSTYDISDSIGIIDDFTNLYDLNPNSRVPNIKTHGQAVQSYLSAYNHVITADCGKIKQDLKSNSEAGETVSALNLKALIESLKVFSSQDASKLPNVINLSISLALPSVLSIQQSIDVRYKNRIGGGFYPESYKASIKKSLQKEAEEDIPHLPEYLPFIEEIKNNIDVLREKGVIIVAAIGNQPNHSEPETGISFEMLTIFPGIIGVGGISISQRGRFYRLGNKELADITGVSVGSRNGGPLDHGNSFATPQVAIGADQIVTFYTKNGQGDIFKNLPPGKREELVEQILKEASATADIWETVKDAQEKYETKRSKAKILSLRILTDNLKKRGPSYLRRLNTLS